MSLEEADLKRLAELKVEVIPGETSYLFRVPHNLKRDQIPEVDRLMEKLGKDRPIEIELRESYPDYLKYVVRFLKEGS